MFARFTKSARAVMVSALQEAQSRGHDTIDTGHLLLALALDEHGLIATTLRSHGISVSSLRARIDAAIGRGRRASLGPVPFTPRARRLLVAAGAEADRRGEHHIDVAHLVAGLAQLDGGVAARVCRELGVEVSLFGGPAAPGDPA